jgi:hypothetical protein
MATVTGLTAARMLEIEAASVVDGKVVGDNLFLTTHGHEQINAGNVRGSPGPGVPPGGAKDECLVKTDDVDYNTKWETRLTQGAGDSRYIKLTGSLIERGDHPPNIAAVPGTIYIQTATGMDLDLGALWVKETGTDKQGWHAFSTFSIHELELGQDLNSITAQGYYRVDASNIANSLINWPVEAIPRTDSANSNNPVGSFRPALSGLLTVTNTFLLVIQTVELLWHRLSDGPLVFTYKRIRSKDGTIWGSWEYISPQTLHVLSSGEKRIVAKEVFLGAIFNRSRTPARLIIDSGNSQPLSIIEDITTDGVQWFRSNTGARQTSSGWTNLTLEHNFEHYTSGSWPELSAIRTSAGIICTRGLLKRTGVPPSGTVIANLPEGMRPADKLQFVGCADNNTMGTTINVETNGDIIFDGTGSNSVDFVDMNMIIFPAADVAPNSAWTTITPVGNWKDVGLTNASWPRLGYWEDQLGRVWLRGLIQYNGSVPAGQLEMFRLPAPYSPAYSTHQVMPMSNAFKRIATMRFAAVNDKNPETSACTFFYDRNPTGQSFSPAISQIHILPVAAIPESNWRSPDLLNDWYNFNPEVFPSMGVWSAPDGIQHIRGLVRGGTVPPVVLNNWGSGDKCDVDSLLAPVATSEVYGRVEVSQPNLLIHVGSIGWVSLDGLHYMLEA